MIIVWSFFSQLQLNCQRINCLHEFSFYFLMNRCIFRYKSMSKSRWTKLCHQFLPIDRYNRYQWNHIHRFLSIYQGQYRPTTRLINRYRFLSIDYPRWIDLEPTRKPYQIALLFTHKNGDFGPISVTERSCAAPRRSWKRITTYQKGFCPTLWCFVNMSAYYTRY